MQAQRIIFLEKEIEQDPRDPFNFYALALEYAAIEPSKASNLYETLLSSFPDYLPVYYKAAEFFEENNQLEKAKDVFEKGIVLAEKMGNDKTLRELKSRYQLFLLENED